MKLLALVLLLSAVSSLALTEVVGSFQRCSEFFMRDPSKKGHRIVPTIFREEHYKMICQRWKKQYRFATLYDTEKRIPVYSAYRFLKAVNTTRNNVWKIEPQLDHVTKNKKGENIVDKREMMDSLNRTQATAMNIIHQAVNSDYNRSGYDRGHVFPRNFSANQDQADSTFTLTNAAPQRHNSNQEWERQVETPMLKRITDNCWLDEVYIVTGVVPGDRWINVTRDKEYKEGINVPSHFWSAFCCTDENDAQTLIGTAYIATQENFSLQNTDISHLNSQLTTLYNRTFSVFPGLTVKNIIPPFIKTVSVNYSNAD